ncbi:MAG: type II toxin-antitoxin system prevent-host-death family antitoxin [Candidatus Berkelbacteria bacterium]|nr:type II toxin-antitoxin system prevent-host-death family antitoxin [Candidatus Berkelbacteria bacterium]
MLEVDIDKILPVTEARDNFNKIIDEVEGSDSMYVLTKNGKPSAVIVGVNHLEKLTGKTADELTSMVEKKADETPVVEEVTPLVPTDSVGAEVPQGDDVAGGSKPLETDAFAAGQSTQTSAATDSSPVQSESGGPIDVPVEVDVSTPADSVGDAPPASVGEAPVPEVSPAPTSSPGGVAQPSPAPIAGAPASNVASNQAPATAPTENGAAASDSDLFV